MKVWFILTINFIVEYECVKSVIAYRPIVFTFENLKSACLYHVKVDSYTSILSSFITLSSVNTFSLIICNKHVGESTDLYDDIYNNFISYSNTLSDLISIPSEPPKTPKTDRSNSMNSINNNNSATIPPPSNIAAPKSNRGIKTNASKLNFAYNSSQTDLQSLDPTPDTKKNIDFIIHNGDQINAAVAFEEAKNIYLDPNKFDEMVECYAKIYRSTWNDVKLSNLLANASNLMLWDDSEIRSEWGMFQSDSNENSVDYQVALAARRAYWLYQRQLWDDIDDYKNILTECESSFHIFGNLGVVFLDTRASRTFNKKSNDYHVFLSDVQVNRLSLALAENGMFSNCSSLVVVSSLPLIYFSTALSSILKYIPYIRDQIGIGSYPIEQSNILDLLVKWKFTIDKQRDVVVIGGDLQYGMISNIYRSGDKVITQLVPSSISSTPPSSVFSTCFNMFHGNCCFPLYGSHYTVTHTSVLYDQCFGLLRIRDKKHIDCKLITSEEIEKSKVKAEPTLNESIKIDIDVINNIIDQQK